MSWFKIPYLEEIFPEQKIISVGIKQDVDLSHCAWLIGWDGFVPGLAGGGTTHVIMTYIIGVTQEAPGEAGKVAEVRGREGQNSREGRLRERPVR